MSSSSKLEGEAPRTADVIYGASSESLAPGFSFFNKLYVHPLFGQMPTWAEQQVVEKPESQLVPIQSRPASEVTPEQRRLARVPWGPRRTDGAFPKFPPDVGLYPTSPSIHVPPSPILPPITKIRERKCHVPASLNPWIRNPPHRLREQQKYERLYGRKPGSPKLASRSSSRSINQSLKF